MICRDHNATTPVIPDVAEATLPYLHAERGNPSSSYGFGAKLKKVLETAREQAGISPGGGAISLAASADLSRIFADMKRGEATRESVRPLRHITNTPTKISETISADNRRNCRA